MRYIAFAARKVVVYADDIMTSRDQSIDQV
jgi:hypothetical protein